MTVFPPRSAWFRQRTLWLPTWRTVLLLIVIMVATVRVLLVPLHRCLAMYAPIQDAKYVVVEGWAPDIVARMALIWAQSHDVKLIYTTGIPMEQGMFLSNCPTYADLAAKTLIGMGADPSMIRTAPAAQAKLERTRAMAQGLKTVLDAQPIPPGDRKLNLFTTGAHAFRSHMHFQRVLGKEWQVGVVSVPSTSYAADAWWHYSDGVRSVIEELVAIAAQSLGAN